MAERAGLAGVLLVAALCAGLLALTHKLTEGRIEANEARAADATIYALLGETPGSPLGGRWQGDVRPLCDGRVLVRQTVQGYAGPIRLLVAMGQDADPHLLGIAVLAHTETPGITDFLNRPDRGWLASLRGASRGDLTHVDAVTGATISSRAIRGGLEALLDDPAVTTLECSS